jgi:general stress protein 26
MNPIGTEDDLAVAKEFVRGQRLAVLSTVTASNEPESALMGVAVTEDLEIVFDTKRTTRKYPNLCGNRRVSLVIGCSSETTVQYEGVAEELSGQELEKYLPIYFEAFPDGPERQNWPGMTYFVVRPKWMRYCDYGQRPPVIREFRW